MAISGTLMMPDIEGESVRDGHEDEIDILSCDWSMAQAATMQSGTGLTTGRATVNPIGISKYYDAASPYLALACMQGKPFDEVVLSFRQDSGEAHLDYLIITLTNVVISSYSVSGGAGADEFMDSLSLSFETVKEKYTVQAEDHSAGAEHEIEYNVATGKS